MRLANPAAARPIRSLVAACALLSAVLAPALPADAQLGGPSHDWKTGPALQRQLDAVIGLTWPDNPLRDSLQRLAQTQQVAMLLDRNVDPGRRVAFASGDLPLAKMLDLVADRLDLAVCYIGPVVYLAPKPVAARAATLADIRRDEMRRLPDAARLAQRKACSWEMLAEPRSLVSAAADEYGVRVENIDRVPHDLWPAADLPPLDLSERLTLLLSGFHLTFAWSADGASIRLVEIDETASVVRKYEQAPTSALSSLASRFPRAKVQRGSRGLVVEAAYETHLAIERLLRDAAAPARKPPPAGAPTERKLYSLRIENKPARAVVATVANDNNWTLVVSPQADAPLARLISLDVKEVSLDELLSKTLMPLGLGWRLSDGKLEVFAGTQ